MIEKQFVQEGINKAKLEEFLNDELGRANYSHININKTPVSTKIKLHAQKPGLVIGRGGARIKELIELLERRFNMENPQLEVIEVEEPDLNARIVAKNVASWLEKGGHPKRVGNTYLRRIMESGATGAQIEITGKLSGSRGRSEKFSDGYLKRCGEIAESMVDTAYEPAVLQPGSLGVKVRIMADMPEYMKVTKGAWRESLSIESTEEPPEEAAESDVDIDLEDLVQNPVKEVKTVVRNHDLDEAALLTLEQDNKNRKTLVEWLENRVDRDEQIREDDEDHAETEATAGDQ